MFSKMFSKTLSRLELNKKQIINKYLPIWFAKIPTNSVTYIRTKCNDKISIFETTEKNKYIFYSPRRENIYFVNTDIQHHVFKTSVCTKDGTHNIDMDVNIKYYINTNLENGTNKYVRTCKVNKINLELELNYIILRYIKYRISNYYTINDFDACCDNFNDELVISKYHNAKFIKVDRIYFTNIIRKTNDKNSKISN